MRLLTQDAVVICKHQLGIVGIQPSQGLVTVEGRRLLVETDPQGRPIVGCPNAGVAIKPCTGTLAVRQGYSDLVRVEGHRVCLDTVTGLTDGTPPGTVDYIVRSPGQTLAGQVS
jgi:hypothetical protein